MNAQVQKKKVLAIDFDGVVHRYSRGWQDGRIYDPPMPGARRALAWLQRKFKIVIFSRRAVHQGTKGIKTWLDRNRIPYDAVTKIKPRARWYIDDRAIRFIDWGKTLKEIMKLERDYPFKTRK